MGMISIDSEKCRKDGLCAAECPMTIIRQKEKDNCPEMVPGGEQVCLICGHCVAVCPHGALSHSQVPVESCPPIDPKISVGEEQMIQFLRSRRSIRVYKDKAVEREKLQRVIEIARYAPTGSNTQLVEWLVLTDPGKLKVLGGMVIEWLREVIRSGPSHAVPQYIPILIAAWDAGYDAVFRNAPVLIVASSPAEDRSGMANVTIALSYLELAASVLGLGTCWAGLLQRALLACPSLKEAVGLPKDCPYHYPMMIGYPKFRYYRLPERKPPRITWR